MNGSNPADALQKACAPIKWDRTLSIVLGCVCLLLSLLASVGNLASLVYVKLNWNVGPKRKANYTHQMTMIMVINIAFTDLLNGLFSASFNAANLFKEEYSMPEPQAMMYLCNFSGGIHYLTTRASLLLMMCLSVFRFIAIKKPTYFSNSNCIKVLWGVIGMVWATTLAITFLPYYLNTRYIYFPDVAHCTFHFWQLKDGLTDICQFLKSGAKTLSKMIFFLLYILPIHGPGFGMIFFTMLILVRLAKLHLKVQKGKGAKRSSEESLHAKAAYSTLQILACFVLTNGPWWIIALVHFFDMFGLVKSDCQEGQYWRCTLGKKYFSLMLFFSMNLLIYLNAAINPFIYYYRLFKRSEKIKKQQYTRGASMASGLARAGSRDLLSKDYTATRGSVSPPHENGEHVKTPLMKREEKVKSNGHNGMTLQVKPAVPVGGVTHRHLEVYTSC
ncbi:cysteinyl leukotriene receptor 2-like isoform X2 [Bolinopsis microptera]|uniref:cysteinyl leukotriene receptor 2-like isoform X2 n=1 Tax=Bolinopsis microptera TaxID=2820187 RepID=UPI003078DD16